MSTNDKDPGLRARLVTTGVALVAAEGAQALTLREIARRTGVSHGAPRRYFPTHLSLLSAIARCGFDALAVEVKKAVEGYGTEPRERLLVLGRIYLDFARTNRGMFELMFRHDLLESGALGLRHTSLPLFRVLVKLVSQARPDADPDVIAGALWANLHGIAQLWGWGSLQMATGVAEPEPLLRAVIDAYVGEGAGARTRVGAGADADAYAGRSGR
ncbi:TetR/AcrR family transcriptional regulator [Streptomyces sp. NPDC050504]|uniref:TetR/AcrR family transcriptional regulator n=1 Tax=Streptomyces sp. NPDC050504 TaxID=3365618 RepID=UPI0037A33228